jgi:hypothetical protein
MLGDGEVVERNYHLNTPVNYLVRQLGILLLTSNEVLLESS